MRGLVKHRQRRIEDRVALDHMQAQMHALAGIGKLRPLDEYLRRVRPRPKRSGAEILATLQAMAARGAPITITKRPRAASDT